MRKSRRSSVQSRSGLILRETLRERMDASLLDTDILSEVLKQSNRNVVTRARQYLRSHGQFAFSAVTRFEIVRGFKQRSAAASLARFTC